VPKGQLQEHKHKNMKIIKQRNFYNNGKRSDDDDNDHNDKDDGND
jgi:hypothetical protein